MSARGRHHSRKHEDFATVMHTCKAVGQRKPRRIMAYVGCPTCGELPHICKSDPSLLAERWQLRRELGAMMGVVRPDVVWPEKESA